MLILTEGCLEYSDMTIHVDVMCFHANITVIHLEITDLYWYGYSYHTYFYTCYASRYTHSYPGIMDKDIDIRVQYIL